MTRSTVAQMLEASLLASSSRDLGSHGEPANVADGLFAIADALNRIAAVLEKKAVDDAI
jgi:hypothetical protein